MEDILRFKDVWVQINNLTILENINLSVQKSDFLGIIGPNGGGKTILLKVALGFIKPTRGEVFFKGQSPEKNRKYMGYVPQYPNFDRDFPISVWEVVLTGRLGKTGLIKPIKKRDKEIVSEMLEKVDMLNLKDRQVGKLSGGQFQRVLIARALAAEPEILLLDEPTTGIDSRVEKNLYELLKKLNEKIPIIMVSHDIGVISSYVNKIACLNRLLHYHSTKEITKDMLEATYKCPVELIAHGLPHRVLNKHTEESR